jgi:DNA gyrase subunit A
MEVIKDVNIAEQNKSDMQSYAVYVTRRRSLPKWMDGLKPIHRRILFCAWKYAGALHNRPHVKSAAIVGDIIKRVHPHGDASTYDSFVGMSNPWDCKVPLLDPYGNWGNSAGDPQAHMRYTSTRISEFAYEALISDLTVSSESVDWSETYDNSGTEPEFFPAKVPLLLINGTSGIAVGIKTDVPTHNLNEVIDATIRVIKDPTTPVVLIPDHCLPCEIVDTDWKAISNTGSGNYRVRGIIEVGEFRNCPALFVKSTPNMVKWNSIKEKLEKMIEGKKLPNVSAIEEDSVGDQLCEIIVLRKGSDPYYIRDLIYKNTDMEATCRVNMELVDKTDIVRMSYKSYIEAFIMFRKTTIFRILNNSYQAVKTKIHEMEAYIKLLESGDIDDIIALIRARKTADEDGLTEYLVKKLKITDLQAKYIKNMNLSKTAMGYIDIYKKTLNDLLKEEKAIADKVINDELIDNQIIEELLYFKKKYGKPRVCKIVSQDDSSSIPGGEFKLVVTEKNFIKKLMPTDVPSTAVGEKPTHVLTVDNRKDVLLFDENGRVYRLPVHRIPLTDRGNSGIDVRFVIRTLTSPIIGVVYLPLLEELLGKTRPYYLTILSGEGTLKKLDISDFINVPSSGLVYSRLNPGDKVVNIGIVAEGVHIIINSHNRVLRLPISEIPTLRRNTIGAKTMKDADIRNMSVLAPTANTLVVITEEGRVHKIPADAIPLSKRLRTGNAVMRVPSNDAIFAVLGVNPQADAIRVTCGQEKIDLDPLMIPDGSSVGTAQKILKKGRADKILKVKIIPKARM